MTIFHRHLDFFLRLKQPIWKLPSFSAGPLLSPFRTVKQLMGNFHLGGRFSQHSTSTDAVKQIVKQI